MRFRAELMRDHQANVAADSPADDADAKALFAAVAAGDVLSVSAILERRPNLIKARDAEGQTLLHAAAWHNDARLAVVLLARGADPDATYGSSGHTPLS